MRCHTRLAASVTVTTWNPWDDLCGREHVTLGYSDLPPATGGAVYGRIGDVAAIVIDPALPRRARTAALAHELVHDEQGGGCPSDGMPASWRPVVLRDERRVNREVARRLVPLDELEEFVVGMADLGLSAGPDEVAENFDVAPWVAEVALERLLARDRDDGRRTA